MNRTDVFEVLGQRRSGVVHQDVYSPEIVQGGLYYPVSGVVVADVSHHRYGDAFGGGFDILAGFVQNIRTPGH